MRKLGYGWFQPWLELDSELQRGNSLSQGIPARENMTFRVYFFVGQAKPYGYGQWAIALGDGPVLFLDYNIGV